MNKENLEKTLNECPKTLDAIKEFYIKLHPNIESYLTDAMLILNITNSPYAVTDYFDSVDMIGSLHYNYLPGRFEIFVNGKGISNDEESESSFPTMGNSDRRIAEFMLVNHLLNESEKIL